MTQADMFQKAMGFAENGNGRRLLNTIKKKESNFSPSQLDDIVTHYCRIGLPKQLEMLKNRRGILDPKQYQVLADKVESACKLKRYDDFIESLSKLLSSGMRMNPLKTELVETDDTV